MIEKLNIFPEGRAIPHRFLELFEVQGVSDRLHRLSAGEDAKRALHLVNISSATKALKFSPSAFDRLDRSVWTQVSQGGGKLMFDMCTEPLILNTPSSFAFVSWLYDGINRHGLVPSSVCVLNLNIKSPEGFGKARQSMGLPPGPTPVGFNTWFWLLNGSNRLLPERVPAFESRLARAKAKILGPLTTKKFASLNGRIRPQRLYFVLWLMMKDHLREGHVSLIGYGAGEGQPDVPALLRKMQFYPELDRVLEFGDALLAQLPMTLDLSKEDAVSGNAFSRVHALSSPDPMPYDDSYFSVIIDTKSYGDVLVLTEKAFKSFMNLSPFVYFGNAGALAEMRRLGFQTFAPLIDEGYDEITDDSARIAAILNEIDRLASMPKSDLRDMYAALWDRLEHNYRHIHRNDGGRAFLADFATSVLQPLGLH